MKQTKVYEIKGECPICKGRQTIGITGNYIRLCVPCDLIFKARIVEIKEDKK